MQLDDVMLGEIRLFPYNFVPQGWLLCDGSKISISQNSALFSIIVTTYGGDGINTFAVPDLRARAPMGLDLHGSNGPPVVQGQTMGSAELTVTPDQVPQHSHPLQRKGATALNQKTNVVGANTNLAQLAVKYNATSTELVPHLQGGTAPNTTFDPASIPAMGFALPHDNRQPFLAMGFFIATSGQYPPRPY